MKNFKLISTILLSIMLILSISTAVFADDDIWNDINVVQNEENSNSSNDENLFENENSSENENTSENNENLSVNDTANDYDDDNNEYNNLYNNGSSTTSNSENLAKTGIGNSNGTIALIATVSILIAVYSAKKINDYKEV